MKNNEEKKNTVYNILDSDVVKELSKTCEYEFTALSEDNKVKIFEKAALGTGLGIGIIIFSSFLK